VKVFLIHLSAKSCRKQTEIRFGKSVGNYGTPAACSEMDHVLSPLPMITSAWQMLPDAIRGSAETGFPSAVIDRTPFSTPSGLST
jgi:hypothetical protein